jgi:peptide/nickel transport system permease protein
VPGTYERRTGGPNVPDSTRLKIAKQLGLDQPLPIRYVNWLVGILKGDFGYSDLNSRPVLNLIKDAIFDTLILLISAICISNFIGIFIGTYTAISRKSLSGRFLTFFFDILSGISDIVLSAILVLLFMIILKWMKEFGKFSTIIMIKHAPCPTLLDPEVLLDYLYHLLFPALALGLSNGLTSKVVRLVKSEVTNCMEQDFIDTAIMKGLSRRKILLKHVMRNVIIPLNSNFWSSISVLLGTIVVVEFYFCWPGIGSLMYKSCMKRDVPVIMGIGVVVSLIVIVNNFLNDLINYQLNPRLKHE